MVCKWNWNVRFLAAENRLKSKILGKLELSQPVLWAYARFITAFSSVYIISIGWIHPPLTFPFHLLTCHEEFICHFLPFSYVDSEYARTGDLISFPKSAFFGFSIFLETLWLHTHVGGVLWPTVLGDPTVSSALLHLVLSRILSSCSPDSWPGLQSASSPCVYSCQIRRGFHKQGSTRYPFLLREKENNLDCHRDVNEMLQQAEGTIWAWLCFWLQCWDMLVFF